MTIEQPHDFQDDSQAAGPGQLLRNAREQLGWTREQVASRIHLRLTLIAAIESDTYDKHTSHTFIRGYLRTYAKLVGIPDETILAAYDKLGLTPPDNIDMQSFSRRSRQQANDSRLKVVTWLVILVLIALSVAWWWQSTSRRSAGDEALAATEMSATGSTPAEPAITPPDAINTAPGGRRSQRTGSHGRDCPCGGLRCDGYTGACFSGYCPDRCQCGCRHCDRCCGIRRQWH